jgi:hypothetical protein
MATKRLAKGKMPMIDEPPYPFLMTPAQHRQWAENARRRNRPDLARHHEQLARAIEIIERRQQAVGPTVASSPMATEVDPLLRLYCTP